MTIVMISMFRMFQSNIIRWKILKLVLFSCDCCTTVDNTEWRSGIQQFATYRPQFVVDCILDVLVMKI